MRKLYLLLPALLAALFSIGQAPVLPLDFESPSTSYAFTDFNGGGTTKIANPQSGGINTSANVGRMIKSTGEVYGGSFISLAAPIDFSVNKTFKVKVFMPRVGAKLLLKVENQNDGGISFEKEATGTVANAWEELSFDYSTISTSQQYQKLVLIFDLGTIGDGSANFTYLFDDILLTTSVAPPPPPGLQMNLPVNFDIAAVNYGLIGFGGAEASSIVTDPTLSTNKVAKVIKSASAELWAGTTITSITNALQIGFSSRIPFTASEKKMTVRVWSPDAGIKVRLKVEDYMDPTKSVETEATTTIAGGWEKLTFDFGNQAAQTAAINLSYNYNKASIFFNFGVTGAVAGEKTYYFDDVEFIEAVTPPPSSTKPVLPLDFESVTFDYTFTDFNGGGTTRIANPQISGINASANVGKMIKSAGEVYGGSFISLASPIDFSVKKVFKVKVFMPKVGAKLLLKVENQTDGAISFEKEVAGTVANAWEELTFDYSTINTANQYQKLVLIFDLGTVGDGSANFTYLFDDVQLTSAVVPPTNPTQMNLPVTFDLANIDYGVVGFGGAEASTIVADPTDATNKVAKVIKSATAELWAGTTITFVSGAIQTGFATKIPFTASEKKLNVRVWSPNAGINVRLKVEDYMDATKSVETEATTTVAGSWETLTFDFGNQAAQTAAINLAYNYNKASIFFNFGVTGAVAGEKTYYFDDMKFGGSTAPSNKPVMPLDFESATLDYSFTDFNGGGTSHIPNPQMNGINTSAHVGKMVKSAGEVWGGSWVSMAAPMDFSVNKVFKVKVFMPRVGAKLLLKVENQTDAGIAFEKEATGTVANAWEELSFDYSTVSTSNQYQKLVLIFDNGTAGDGSANFTYLFDDVRLVNSTLPVTLSSFKATLFGNSAQLKWVSESELNSDHYIIERSTDAIHFTDRGNVASNGTSSVSRGYQFTDDLSATPAIVYYRLKIIDANGKFTYSAVATLRKNINVGIDNLKVYPNPFAGVFTVSLNSIKAEQAGIRILSMNGTEMIKRKLVINEGDNKIELKNFGVLPKGNYILEITTPTQKLFKKILSN